MATPTPGNPTGANLADVGPQPSQDDGTFQPMVLNGNHPGAVQRPRTTGDGMDD